MRILIVYGTTEGHTRELAQFIAARLTGAHHGVAIHAGSSSRRLTCVPAGPQGWTSAGRPQPALRRRRRAPHAGAWAQSRSIGLCSGRRAPDAACRHHPRARWRDGASALRRHRAELGHTTPSYVAPKCRRFGSPPSPRQDDTNVRRVLLAAGDIDTVDTPGISARRNDSHGIGRKDGADDRQ